MPPSSKLPRFDAKTFLHFWALDFFICLIIAVVKLYHVYLHQVLHTTTDQFSEFTKKITRAKID